MKRFRVRPYRADKGYQFWGGGPDAGRVAPIQCMHLGQTAGEVIDRLLKHKKSRKIDRPIVHVLPAVTLPDGSGRSEMYVFPKRPPYPEH